MTDERATVIPEIDLTAMQVIRDPFTAYGEVRERSPLARLTIPGIGPVWLLTRYEGARAMLADPRFGISTQSFVRPGVPEDCLPYMRTMSEMEGSEHLRLRKLVAPAFGVRRAAGFRPRIEPIAARLLDELPGHADNGVVDLLRHYARPLPMDVICELVGIPHADRLAWREYGAVIAAGSGQGLAEAMPGIIAGARDAVARRRAEPADDLLSDLIRAHDDDGDRLSDTEMITMIWLLVLAGQTPHNLIGNAVAALLTHPGRLAALRADPALMPRAVEELTRWCGPILLAVPRYAREDTELYGTKIRQGDAITAAVAAANHDPRAFPDPARLDITRTPASPHLGFSHGPHFCLGAALARVQVETALTALLARHPGLALAADPEEIRALDPGMWRLTSLPVTL
ncbi:cytochrome P450 [Sphaerisporangium rubeum]|uniref:Cytochrome P450 n=1 Tax=Sphaerisporangium rubeum TaxID=321317 RepID=A0A7X0IG40_9ACTN|nr:cytochrome P450 [Sphaerisporangium rubeum]